MNSRRLVIVSAGLGQPSSTRLLADRLAQATVAALGEDGVSAGTHVVELRDLAHDLTNDLLTSFESPELREAKQQVADADGVIAVTPIFSASYSGLFKTFFDVLDDGALAGTPVLIAATAGTARHSLALEHALRPLFAYLKAVVVPTAVFAASEDWGAVRGAGGQRGGTERVPGLGDGLATRIARAGGELAHLVAAPRAGAGADPFENPVPFEQLLQGR